MSYQVLARKWRPRNFSEVVGQQHVLQALTNALTHQRLHHAYLLTGTRGVGKTTIARILSRSLNCVTGITPTPCGECSACIDIEAGRFVDLMEIDAASRTKVEDTREILENVQYRPTSGRYKVYLIDEVHMLSRHSFNALLKTLEEPPPHVVFVLATTDPDKLPVTVLSRCLQFSLRALTRDEIAGQLQHILAAENIPFEPSALALLARSASGSMRDALSLTDQAIAQGDQQVNEQEVARMLGRIDSHNLIELLNDIADGDVNLVLNGLRGLVDKVPDIAGVLSELQGLLHQLALVQVAPSMLDPELHEQEQQMLALAKKIDPAAVQVYYRLVLEGRRELAYAPDAFSGVEMTLLRLLAFRPAVGAPVTAGKPQTSENKPASELATKTQPAKPAAVGKEPSAAGKEPSAQNKEPSAAGKEPSAQNKEPSAQNKEPSAAGKEPSAQNKEPSTASEQPLAETSQTKSAVIIEEAPELEESIATNMSEFAAHEIPGFIEEDEEEYESLYAEQQGIEAQAAGLIPRGAEANDSARNNSEPATQESSANVIQERVKQQEVGGEPDGGKRTEQQPTTSDLSSLLATRQRLAAKRTESSKSTPSTSTTSVDAVNSLVGIDSNIANKPAIETKLEEAVAPSIQDSPANELSETPVVAKKIVAAAQVDEWAATIEQLNIVGRTRQVLLHSMLHQTEDRLVLEVDEAQQGLLSGHMDASIKHELGKIMNVERLQIKTGAPERTPFRIQQEIDAKLLKDAQDRVAAHPGIQQLQSNFSAELKKVDVLH
ncbi:DNA polymerase III, subunit gamma/tau [Idiomarina sp. A28L]|uniref:DNA polymerase III subunit gamma/tau n=1 Tax=Idiomarina sp. A28L TaxID=1036674 RepID=UPI0002138CF6|nr:DNA polymerase III subunit gamma/tau [Idiomarina sp. A28L]EGN74430.1 DNA polymerase III, subunit gamma/tau [Idiomarina sp. A28L]